MRGIGVKKGLLRTKAINADHHLVDTGLRRVLGPLDLTLLGIGAVIGAGIFVLTGEMTANAAGPSILVSFVISLTFESLGVATGLVYGPYHYT